MRKKLLLCLFLILSACAPKEEVVSNENSSIVYEIFPYSFYDSNGNGVGDLKGITSKLDYIRSLGAGYIWLTPISQSTTYHKYDVVDYMSIDSVFGTMDDFDELVEKANEKNIGIVFDLVLNHTSSKHPWFKQAQSDLLNNKCDEEGSMCNWYNFSTEKKTGYTLMGGGYYYESVFWSEMPDLNLDEPAVREEIKKIVKFWIDKGVKGFRLDAPYHYYNGNATKNGEFLTWLENEIKAIDADCFLVGEVWSDMTTIQRHYDSGFDSFFNFDASSSTGKIASTIRSKQGNSLANFFVNYNSKIKENNPTAIDSVFLSNHDQGRSGAIFGNQIEKSKLMASVLLFAPGRVYMYYGEEIGMLGSGDDPNKRMPMLWSNTDKTGITFNPPGVNYTSQVNTSVEVQEKDKESLLNHYRKVANIRNKSTLYETGEIEVVDIQNASIYGMKFYNDEESLMVFHNFGDTEVTFVINESVSSFDSTNSKSKIKNNNLTLQPLSSVVVYLGE